MTEYFKGQTIWIHATWKDKNGAAMTGLTNDKHTIKITDPKGADKTGTLTIEEVGNGEYFFKYQIDAKAAEGDWIVNWKVTVNSDVGIEEHTFTVK